MEAAGNLILAGYNVEAVNWCWIVCMWKDATMHHPEAFRLSSINHINVGPTVVLTSPYTVNPTRLIKTIHSRFEDFLARAFKRFLK
jgi:hypothetical protein